MQLVFRRANARLMLLYNAVMKIWEEWQKERKKDKVSGFFTIKRPASISILEHNQNWKKGKETYQKKETKDIQNNECSFCTFLAMPKENIGTHAATCDRVVQFFLYTYKSMSN